MKFYLLFSWFIILANYKASDPNYSDKIENFSLQNVITYKKESLTDYKEKKVVVLVFASNYCPFFKIYENRIINIAKDFSGKGVQFLLINSNNPDIVEEDGVSFMNEKALGKNYPFPYLADKDQQVRNRFKAVKTPEVFVLENRQNNFYLYYCGAIDDSPTGEANVKQPYLINTINAILNKTNLQTRQNLPTGCMIK